MHVCVKYKCNMQPSTSLRFMKKQTIALTCIFFPSLICNCAVYAQKMQKAFFFFYAVIVLRSKNS